MQRAGCRIVRKVQVSRAVSTFQKEQKRHCKHLGQYDVTNARIQKFNIIQCARRKNDSVKHII